MSVQGGYVERWLQQVVIRISFWLAIVLAFVYPAILIAIDQGFAHHLHLFAFIGIHVISLVMGRGYNSIESSH